VEVANDLIPPDPAKQGGWPFGAGYFYLPKQFLTNVSYRALADDQITDEATALLGMSAAEREAVNQLFSNRISEFRRAEIERMQRIDPPAEWRTNDLDWSLVYHIPSLAPELEMARRTFSQRLNETLGATRVQLLEESSGMHFQNDYDALGARQRIVGFFSKSESDGSHSLWYAMWDSRPGFRALKRVSSDNADLQVAYYAKLFGVKLPGP
jgi:hypothetical protein